MRVNGFVTGGAVPPARRGTTAEGLVAIEDWYATFCALAGADPYDAAAAAAKLPQPDGLNQWPYLSGANATSPRQYVYMGSSDASNAAGNAIVTGVLRNDGYKLLLGKLGNNWWTGPVYPNSSTYPTGSHDCGAGCLFNVFTVRGQRARARTQQQAQSAAPPRASHLTLFPPQRSSLFPRLGRTPASTRTLQRRTPRWWRSSQRWRQSTRPRPTTPSAAWTTARRAKRRSTCTTAFGGPLSRTRRAPLRAP